MKEIRDIVVASQKAQRLGKKAALATVVHVEGSSYRRPGARMLVTDDGQLTGAISGGCLEGDALRKALLCIHQQQNKIITYNSLDEEDDLKFGAQLGCNGIAHILFEPIIPEKEFNPIHLLEQVIKNREHALIATLYSLSGKLQPGTSLLYKKNLTQSTLPSLLQLNIMRDIRMAFHNQFSTPRIYEYDGLQLNAFLEFIPPVPSLIIAGAGNDAIPLAELTAWLGWRTTVIDGRPTHATVKRFPKADQIIIGKPSELQLEIDPQTFFVLMTHNYNYDFAMLKELLKFNCRYIGILGPKTKLNRMITELKVAGIILNKKQLDTIHSPVGLDIDAETADEIAISIVAEIKAVMSGTKGFYLKEKKFSIHPKPCQY
jgi:xanthine dehydrogenase accessory factor